MKKLFFLITAFVQALNMFAQCDPSEIKNMPSVYNKAYAGSYQLIHEQEKWLTAIFTSVMEPALKNTKGLSGSWEPMGDFKVTAEGFTKSVLESFMFLAGCKDNKLYEIHEQGLILDFNLNDFRSILKSEIAEECQHEETKWTKFDESKTVYVNDLLDGKQIYYLQPSAATGSNSNITFYRKTNDGEYFVIAKPGTPLFIPVTIRQALEINRKNYTNLLQDQKKQVSMPGLQPETRAEYEKRMAKDFAAYRESLPNAEQFITDLIKQLEETKLALIKQEQFFIDMYTKNIVIVTEYLKNTPAKELDKACITGNTGFLLAGFSDGTDITSIQSNFKNNEPGSFGRYITLNPEYFSKSTSKIAPQFISVELRIQGNSAVALKAYNDFRANLDLNKLQSLLAN
ncbi:MAG: hypothetical protein ABI405_13380 [Parafilimonas sp.]